MRVEANPVSKMLCSVQNTRLWIKSRNPVVGLFYNIPSSEPFIKCIIHFGYSILLLIMKLGQEMTMTIVNVYSKIFILYVQMLNSVITSSYEGDRTAGHAIFSIRLSLFCIFLYNLPFNYYGYTTEIVPIFILKALVMF
jgi:hypothetical protein